jgi:hypothetical protein
MTNARKWFQIKKKYGIIYLGDSMSSRMEKYYRSQTSTSKRSERNQDLYREIYDLGEYSNIEAVATLEHTNEIDITKIKKMLKNREDYKRQKEYRSLLRGEDEPVKEEIIEPKEEVKNYDIKEALNKIYDNKQEDDEYRSLNNTNYNILKELKIKNDHKKELSESEDKELKEMINTITSTSLLNKLDNEELSLNMFEDLASSGETKIEDKNSVQALLEEAKALEQKKREESTPNEIDNSFYTSSLNFDSKDFEDLYDKENKKTKVNLKIKLVVGAILLVISVIIIFLIYNFLK